MNQAIISVLTPDRVGILRDVTRLVFERGGNIAAIHQTIVHGFFNLILTAAFEPAVDHKALATDLITVLGADAAVTVHPFIEAPRTPLPNGPTYVVTTHGADRPGTVYAISQFFVDHGINIIDWIVENDGDAIAYIAKVVLPAETQLRLLQSEFRAAMAQRGLRASICHSNIYRATSEMGAIHDLLPGT